MCNQRGLIRPAIVTTTIALVLAAILWGAFAALTFAKPEALSTAAHRYLCILLATATTCSVIVNMTARALRAILAAIAAEGTSEDYARGYADGLDARPVSPAVTRLVPLHR